MNTTIDKLERTLQEFAYHLLKAGKKGGGKGNGNGKGIGTGKVRGGKYYKREIVNGRMKYYYTQEQYEKEHKKDTEKKKQSKEPIQKKYNLNAFLAYFGISKTRDGEKKISIEYSNAKDKIPGISPKDFMRYTKEYFSNRSEIESAIAHAKTTKEDNDKQNKKEKSSSNSETKDKQKNTETKEVDTRKAVFLYWHNKINQINKENEIKTQKALENLKAIKEKTLNPNSKSEAMRGNKNAEKNDGKPSDIYNNSNMENLIIGKEIKDINSSDSFIDDDGIVDTGKVALYTLYDHFKTNKGPDVLDYVIENPSNSEESSHINDEISNLNESQKEKLGNRIQQIIDTMLGETNKRLPEDETTRVAFDVYKQYYEEVYMEFSAENPTIPSLEYEELNLLDIAQSERLDLLKNHIGL